MAVDFGFFRDVTRLAQGGQGVRAKIEDKEDSGETSLSEAALLGKTDAVKVLLDRGANIETNNGGLGTPLVQAAKGGSMDEGGYIDTVRLLLDRGANVKAKDRITNLTALVRASKSGYTDIVDLLRSHGASG